MVVLVVPVVVLVVLVEVLVVLVGSAVVVLVVLVEVLVVLVGSAVVVLVVLVDVVVEPPTQVPVAVNAVPFQVYQVPPSELPKTTGLARSVNPVSE